MNSQGRVFPGELSKALLGLKDLLLVGFFLSVGLTGAPSIMGLGVALALIVSSLAFGIGLSPLGGLMAARVTAAAFGTSLVAVGITAWRGPFASVATA